MGGCQKTSIIDKYVGILESSRRFDKEQLSRIQYAAESIFNDITKMNHQEKSAVRTADFSTFFCFMWRDIILGLIFLFILCLCGCQYLPDPKYIDTNGELSEEIEGQEGINKHDNSSDSTNGKNDSISVALPPEQVKKERMTIGDGWEETNETNGGVILNGTIVYTILGARAVTNIQDVSMTEKSFLAYDSIIIWYENYQEKSMAYPECVQEDGSLAHGAKLILVDIKVENIDAESAYSERKGYDLDLFRADSILQFCDYGDMSLLPEEGERLYYPYFFDQAATDYSEQMNPFLYKISPGETKIITVGTLVCERYDGTKVNLSDLGVVIKQNAKHLYFDLGLSDE